MVAEVDKDNTGKLTMENFMFLMSKKMFEKDTKEEIMKAFKLFDDDDSGNITFTNLKRVAKQLDENMADEELQVWKANFMDDLKKNIVTDKYSARYMAQLCACCVLHVALCMLHCACCVVHVTSNACAN